MALGEVKPATKHLLKAEYAWKQTNTFLNPAFSLLPLPHSHDGWDKRRTVCSLSEDRNRNSAHLQVHCA